MTDYLEVESLILTDSQLLGKGWDAGGQAILYKQQVSASQQHRISLRQKEKKEWSCTVLEREESATFETTQSIVYFRVGFHAIVKQKIWS